MSGFYDDFEAGLTDFQNTAGEPWKFGNLELQAIEIETITASVAAMAGGKFKDVTVTVNVFHKIVVSSGVAEGSVIVVRGERVRIKEISNDGDGTRTLLCGSPGVKTPR